MNVRIHTEDCDCALCLYLVERQESKRLRARVKALEEGRRKAVDFLAAIGLTGGNADHLRVLLSEPEEDGLPKVAGKTCLRILSEMERAGLVLLRDEQAKPSPDNALIGYLCDAVRLARELPWGEPEEDGRENEGEPPSIRDGPTRELAPQDTQGSPIPPSWAEVRLAITPFAEFSIAPWEAHAIPMEDHKRIAALLSRLPTTEPAFEDDCAENCQEHATCRTDTPSPLQPGPDAFYCSLCRAYVGEHLCKREPAPSPEEGGELPKRSWPTCEQDETADYWMATSDYEGLCTAFCDGMHGFGEDCLEPEEGGES